jgi:uncharacterized cupredoxin-like copper-binding protein
MGRVGSMLRSVRVAVPWTTRIGLSAALASLLIGCTTTGSPPATPSAAPSADSSDSAGTVVDAALSEFKIDLSATSAPAGAVTFAVTNNGTTMHEFIVFQTDLAADKLPLSADGTMVDEEGAEGLTVIDEIEDVEVGATTSLDVTLPAAHFVIICNVPTHYTSGMHVEFTTTGS